MYGLTRGTMTLIGVAAAGFLLWLAAQFQAEGSTEYWIQRAVIAGAGLTIALSQLVGGWTKWGRPRLSGMVFLLGFVPALVVGGLVLLHMQPDGGFGSSWASDLGLGGIADDLGGLLPAIAFLIGLTFGLTFDTTGRRVRDADVDRDEVVEERGYAGPVPVASRDDDETVVTQSRYAGPVPVGHRDGEDDAEADRRYAGPVPVDRRDADEPVAAERDEVGARHPYRDVDDGDGVTRRSDRERDHVETRAARRDDHDVRDGDGRYRDSDREPAAETREPRRRGLFRR